MYNVIIVVIYNLLFVYYTPGNKNIEDSHVTHFIQWLWHLIKKLWMLSSIFG